MFNTIDWLVYLLSRPFCFEKFRWWWWWWCDISLVLCAALSIQSHTSHAISSDSVLCAVIDWMRVIVCLCVRMRGCGVWLCLSAISTLWLYIQFVANKVGRNFPHMSAIYQSICSTLITNTHIVCDVVHCICLETIDRHWPQNIHVLT